MAFESTGPEQGWIETAAAVCRRQNDQIRVVAKAVEFSQELRDDAITDPGVATEAVSIGGDRVDLVEKDDGGGGLSGALEDLPNRSLGFANLAGPQFRPRHLNEVNLAFARNRACEKCLSGSGWPVEEDAGRRGGVGGIEQRPVHQRPRHCLFEL